MKSNMNFLNNKKVLSEEVISCQICGESAGWRSVIHLPKFLFKHEAHILSCRDCTVGRTDPPPSTSIEYYEHNDRNDKLFTERANLYKSFSVDFLMKLDRKTPNGIRLLDFGCGGGFMVEAAKEMGFDAYGIEANMAMVQWCQERGLDVQSKSIEALSGAGERYDIIIFSAVLEHIEDPLSILVQCKKLLLPDGIMAISQAAYDGLLPKVFPWGWYGWQPQEHFWHFNKRSLQRMTSRAGLEVQRSIRNNLHHPWFKKGSILELVGRNIAALIARVGLAINRGDNIIFIVHSV